ncbi:MAG: NAD(P)-dependent oxidoreductase [Sphingomonas sanxanigenens]|uniref:NAD(P)-dependent oxidoreductase n=1 Tax=Sphingomonas sanxanigenens TaxID=397260 RepID=A0A2W5AB90_9SPHN|nr:MAG: NAD(P)-dependent oxidoreductase [Sphingomonas sanxanigenens]
MSRLLVFGPGYTASRLIDHAARRGWAVNAVDRVSFHDAGRVDALIGWSTHILSSIPPDEDGDPLLRAHGAALAAAERQMLYLSSTGVYGDAAGAWIDESAPTAPGRRPARLDADGAWRTLFPDAFVFRLPGIYGPGRSPIDRLRDGQAHRVDLPGQMFSRIHVDDIVAALILAIEGGAPGLYNLADDRPAAQADVVAHAARLIGLAPPPFTPLADLPPAMRAFYGSSRRIANGKAKRQLGWRPLYPDYRAGLRALSAIASPTSASAPPTAASTDQR